MESPEKARSNKAFHLNYYFLGLSVSFDQQLVLVADLTEKFSDRSERDIRGGFLVDSRDDVSLADAGLCTGCAMLNSNNFEGSESRAFGDNRKPAHVFLGKLIEL